MIALVAAVGSFAVPAPARAASQEQQLEELVRRQGELIRTLEARIAVLEDRAASAAPLQIAPANGPGAPVSSTTAGPAALIVGTTTIKLRGRLHADAWSVSNGVDGSELRRARLGVEGKIDGAMPYVVEVDFAGNAVSLQDAFFDYPVTRNVALRLGYHKVPFSLDDQTSDNYNLFLEHPVGVNPFVPGRGVAAAVLAHGDHWFAHAGVFGEGENDARDGAVDEGITYAARLAWAPVLEKGRYLHLAAAGYRTKFGRAPALQLRERPERRLSQFVVSTGPIDADKMSALGLETAFSWGSVGLAAEYALAHVSDSLGRDLDYSGYSIEGWWNLTGELRPYSVNGGVFGRMAPRRAVTEGGFGAWQVAVRYSRLDLNDPALRAGILETLSLGLNWHLTSHARLMLDVNRSQAKRPSGDLDQTGVGARVQVDW